LTAQIAQLSKLLGQGQYPDSDIHTGIANDYILLGNGKAAYQEYLEAIEASSTYALGYDNLGGLFARLYATSTATRAYAKAVALAPEQLLFQLSYLDYLAEIAPNAPATAAAFANAKQQPGGATNPNLLIAEAGWLTQIGSTTAAIADWQEVEKQEPSAAIEARIAELEK
jgi:tetratricopeptide (TPR) repeat protein